MRTVMLFTKGGEQAKSFTLEKGGRCRHIAHGIVNDISASTTVNDGIGVVQYQAVNRVWDNVVGNPPQNGDILTDVLSTCPYSGVGPTSNQVFQNFVDVIIPDGARIVVAQDTFRGVIVSTMQWVILWFDESPIEEFLEQL